MAVQKPALTTALTNWQQRAGYYQSLGIPQSQWYQIATSDIQNVASTGATPMSTAEVNAAMASQLAGRTLIGNPQRHPHGLWGDIESVFTSAPSDVSHIITGFLPGIAHFAAHLPSELSSTYEYLRHGGMEELVSMGLLAPSRADQSWLTSHGYEDPAGNVLHRFAAELANLAKTPVGSLLPGLADVANMTSGAGRQYLLTHPVSAALDVAPAGHILGLLSKTALPAAEAGTALEALQAGRPIVATSRAVATGTERLPGGVGEAVTRMRTPDTTGLTSLQRVANELGVGALAQRSIRGKEVIGRTVSGQLKAFRGPLVEAWDQLTTAERERVTRSVTLNDPSIILTAKEQAAANVAREFVDKTIREGEGVHKETRGRIGFVRRDIGGFKHTFSPGDPVIRPLQRMERIERQIPKIQTEIRRAADRLAEADRAVNDAMSRLLNAWQTRPTGPFTAEERAVSEAQAEFRHQQTRLDEARAKLSAKQSQLGAYRADFNRKLQKMGGSREMRPQVERSMREAAAARMEQLGREEEARLAPLADPSHPLYDPASYQNLVADNMRQIQAALDTVHNGTARAIKQAFVDTATRFGNDEAKKFALDEWDRFRADAVRNVLQMIRDGFQPVWLHHVAPGDEPRFEGRYGNRATVIPDHIYDPKQFRSQILDFSPYVSDMALGITAAARDLFSMRATDQFLREHVIPHAKIQNHMEEDYRKLAVMDHRARKRLPTRTILGHAQALMKEAWEPLDPKKYGLADWSGYAKFSATDKLVVPKWLAQNLDAMMPVHDPERFGSAGARRLSPTAVYDKTLRVFRFSVLTGPRHLVHVGAGGIEALMMREPFAPLYLAQSLKILKEIRAGNHEHVLAGLSKHLYPDITDGVYSKAVGHQFGMWLRKFWEHKFGPGGWQRGLATLEETVSDMYRISAALAAQSKLGGRASIEEAIVRGNKVAVDMDGMAPIERTVLKRAFPFYGFLKFLFRYLLTYPVDHPYRAAILSRFANQEYQDWNSLLPEKFTLTLFLGQPDQHGNIKTVDLRNLNPFRSYANDLTTVGFFQSLNPVLEMPFTMRGFNVLSGVGPLYPSLEYNASSGTLQAATPTGTDKLASAIEQFVPEFGTLDHFIGLTDQMRILKRTNPAAYKAQLYSQLNLPGILAPPISVNLPYVEEKAEMDRYRAAQQAVSYYEEGKSTATPISSYSLIPYQGQYTTPEAFAAYWQQLLQGTPAGIDPRALMSTPIRKTSQDPLELLTGLGGTLPPPPPPHHSCRWPPCLSAV